MLFQRPDQVPSELVVVTPIFNPLGYRSRWKLYEDFKYMVERAGVKLMTVEVAFANREFAVTKPGDPWNLQLRTNSELWLKENLINLAVARIPQDWSYVAWVDADIAFARHDWANETIRKLQHHPVVQMWSQATDLTPDYETLQGHRSFAWCYHNDGEPKMGRYGMHGRKHHWHPGYGWAWRREAWDFRWRDSRRPRRGRVSTSEWPCRRLFSAESISMPCAKPPPRARNIYRITCR